MFFVIVIMWMALKTSGRTEEHSCKPVNWRKMNHTGDLHPGTSTRGPLTRGPPPGDLHQGTPHQGTSTRGPPPGELHSGNPTQDVFSLNSSTNSHTGSILPLLLDIHDQRSPFISLILASWRRFVVTSQDNGRHTPCDSSQASNTQFELPVRSRDLPDGTQKG